MGAFHIWLLAHFMTAYFMTAHEDCMTSSLPRRSSALIRGLGLPRWPVPASGAGLRKHGHTLSPKRKRLIPPQKLTPSHSLSTCKDAIRSLEEVGALAHLAKLKDSLIRRQQQLRRRGDSLYTYPPPPPHPLHVILPLRAARTEQNNKNDKINTIPP